MLKELDEYGWREAFGFAGEQDTFADQVVIEPCNPTGRYDLSPFTREDVTSICKMDEGDNDGPDWIIYGQLKDGRWFFLSAGCDYTGWDCRGWGNAEIGASQEEIERFSLSDEERKRFGITLAEQQ